MGVKATLADVTLSAADITQAETLGIDAKGLMVVAQAKCDDLKRLLGVLVNGVLSPAGASTNATTLNNQITALSWSTRTAGSQGLAGTLCLDRRAWRRAIRAEHATISFPRTQHLAADG